jgi:hypothetical protein
MVEFTQRAPAFCVTNWRFGAQTIMPTLMSISGVRVVIYLNDHRPAHVHLLGPDHKAVIDLHCPGGPLSLRENYGFSRNELRRLMSVLDARVAALCVKWRVIHGHY